MDDVQADDLELVLCPVCGEHLTANVYYTPKSRSCPACGTILRKGMSSGESLDGEEELGTSFSDDAVASPSAKRAVSAEQTLWDAVSAGKTAKVFAIIKQNPGIDVNYRDPKGRGATPLHVACAERRANMSIVRQLLDAGAAPDAVDNQNATPLHEAVKSDHNVHVVVLLVEQGAPIDAMDDDGYTPLHIACSYATENSTVVDALVRIGADTTIRNKSGHTAEDEARRHGFNESVLLLGGEAIGLDIHSYDHGQSYDHVQPYEVYAVGVDGYEDPDAPTGCTVWSCVIA